MKKKNGQMQKGAMLRAKRANAKKRAVSKKKRKPIKFMGRTEIA